MCVYPPLFSFYSSTISSDCPENRPARIVLAKTTQFPASHFSFSVFLLSLLSASSTGTNRVILRERSERLQEINHGRLRQRKSARENRENPIAEIVQDEAPRHMHVVDSPSGSRTRRFGTEWRPDCMRFVQAFDTSFFLQAAFASNAVANRVGDWASSEFIAGCWRRLKFVQCDRRLNGLDAFI